jgi:hypothetical protein
MGDLFKDIFPALLGVVFCAWWWFIAKEAASKKYIILWGVCFVISCIANIIAGSFNIDALIGVAILTFLGSIYFLIKAALSEHKAKKKSSHD